MLIEEMTWQEVEKSIEQQQVLIIPIGSIEQHGPHLPLTTDLNSVLGISKLVAQEIEVVVAPPLYYTYTRASDAYPGTVSIEASTLITLIRDIVADFIRQGFHKILLLSGHYENLPFLQAGVEVGMRDGRPSNAKVVIAPWWELIPEEVVKQIYPGEWDGWAGTHASLVETSLAMTLKPELVRTDQIVDDEPPERVPYDIFPMPLDRLPKSGVYATTSGSSKELGDQLKEVVVAGVIRLIDKEFN